MTDARETIARLRALHEAATPGAWEADLEGDRHDQPLLYGPTRDRWIALFPHQCLVSTQREGQADCELIAAMRNALPALLDAVDAAVAFNSRSYLVDAPLGLMEELRKLRRALAKLGEAP